MYLSHGCPWRWATPSRADVLSWKTDLFREDRYYNTIDYSGRRINCEPNYDRFDSLGESDLVVYTLACQCDTIKHSLECDAKSRVLFSRSPGKGGGSSVRQTKSPLPR